MQYHSRHLSIVESDFAFYQASQQPVVAYSMPMPHMMTAENTFYSLNGPAFSRREFGGAAGGASGHDRSSVASSENGARLKWHHKYFTSAGGISRFILIFMLLGGIISAALVPKDANLFEMFPDLSSTRSAYLFFVCFSFIISIFIWSINVSNFINLSKVKKLPWNLIIAVLDVLFMITILAVSITCAAREAQLKNFGPNIYSYARQGAFAAAAFFGFAAFILHLSCFICWIISFSSFRREPDSRSMERGSSGAQTSGLGEKDASKFRANSDSSIRVERQTSEII